jgi:hypothetical protein
MSNRFAGYRCNGGMPFEKSTPAVATTAKPINRRPRRDDDDDDVINNVTIPNSKGMTDPFAKMLDRQALAYQAQFGGSYESAYVKVYTDPSNRSIVDAATTEHLAQSLDNMIGTQLSGTNVSADIHKRRDELILDIQARRRAEITGESYAKAYAEIYYDPENIALRKAEAPADARQDFVDRGPNHAKLHRMALEHSARHGLTYEQSYARIYESPSNAQLRAGIAAEAGVRTLTPDEARALSPSRPFPAYGDIGDVDYKMPNVGRSGKKPPNYAGG